MNCRVEINSTPVDGVKADVIWAKGDPDVRVVLEGIAPDPITVRIPISEVIARVGGFFGSFLKR